MITPTAPVVVPPIEGKTADGIWITSVNINSPAADHPIRANIVVAPFISSTGEILRNLQKPIVINDVMAQCAKTPSVANAMNAIFVAVQELVVSRSLF